MTTFRLLNQWLSRKMYLPVSTFMPTMTKVPLCRSFCTNLADSEMVDLVEYLDSLKNYEKSGVPQNAGTDSDDGFDLSRMRRLMDQLGNPESNYKIVHIAGTKGKGSTAAFLSNILRAEGYSVGCYTSPHIRSIRERMSVGGEGEPVSAKELDCVFRKIKRIMDQAVQSEHGHLSHFEVLTAIAFTLFADRNVDIAVVEAGLGGARDATNVIRSSKLATAIITTIGKEHLAVLGGSLESIAFAKSGIIKNGCPVILGGPFLPQIENIIRNKASLMCSPVVSSFDSGNVSAIKGLHDVNGIPRQSCDIVIQIEKDIPLSVELLDLKLSMLGYHQLQNAVTATCAALCLRHQGWRIRESSIRSGLENTQLLGRSQFLKPEEVEALGLHGSTILLDGAHTQESAKALVDTIVMARPGARLVLVVAMASDKDHIGFAKELLSGLHLEAVFLTEVHIAGDKSRTASASFLKECWTRASAELGIDSGKMILDSEKSLITSLRTGDEIIRSRKGEEFGIILVTGSLHIVSSVLASISC